MKLRGIYLLTHIESGRKYVGQSVDIQKRWAMHARGHKKTKLGAAVIKYGWSAFAPTVIEVCEASCLNIAEMKWIQHHACVSPLGFNLTTGGSRQTKYSDETKAKIGAANSRRIVSKETKAKLRARIVSDEAKAKMSSSSVGKIHSEATKQKISAASKLNAPIAIARLIAANTGSKHSEETKAKRAAHHIGAKRSAEACANISASKLGKPANLETKIRLKTMNIGRKHSAEFCENISAALKGIKKSPTAVANSVAAKSANRAARLLLANPDLFALDRQRSEDNFEALHLP